MPDIKPSKSLSKKKRISIARDIVIKNPRWWRTGYNIMMKQHFKDNYGYALRDNEATRLKQKALKDIQNDDRILINRQQLLEMLFDLYEESTNTADKIRIFQEIGKTAGISVEKIELSGTVENQAILTDDIIKQIKDTLTKEQRLNLIDIQDKINDKVIN